MPGRSALATLLLAALVVSGCGSGGSVGRPEHTAPAVADHEGMGIASDAFGNEGRIPTRYTCDGDDVSPPLTISELPVGTAALAVIMDDPDAPAGTWDHWVGYDIPVTATFPEDASGLGTEGINSWGAAGYRGPCPPSGAHRYFFTVYALDAEMGLESGLDKAAVLDAIEGHVLSEATLIGRYSR